MILKGMTWSHERGVKPLIKASECFNKLHPEVEITWDARSLSDFEIFPLEQLASKYDFIMIDHPHIGTAYAEKLLLPLDELISDEFIKDQEENSVGLSHLSYRWEGHQWALAADSAAQFSAYRKDILDELGMIHQPMTWKDVLSLAKNLPEEYEMAIPFVPIHAYSSFFSCCSQISDTQFWSEGKALKEEVGVKVLTLLADILDNSNKKSFDMDPINLLDHMAEHNQIVYCPLVYGYSTYSEAGYAKNRIKFDEMPSDTGKPNGSMIGGVGLSISSKCEAPEIAAKFIEMTVSGEFQSNEFVDSYGQPGHRQAWTDKRVNEKSLNFYRDTLDTMDYGSMRPRFNGYIEFQEKCGKMIRQFMIDKRVDYKEFINELNTMFFEYYND